MFYTIFHTSMYDKIMPMPDAVKKFVRGNSFIYFGGFSHSEPYAAAHEIIRQKKRNLVVTRAAGGVLFDQMIGAGCVKEVITSHIGNVIGPAPCWAFRRAVEQKIPRGIKVREHSVFSLTLAYFAASVGLPFMPTKSVLGSDVAEEKKEMECPFSGEKVALIPAIKPDVGFVHVQRCDTDGTSQLWGILGDTKYGINACRKVVVCAEEIVDTSVIRAEAEKTIIPGFRVDAVVEVPWGGHPNHVQGYYNRDIKFHQMYARETKTLEGFEGFMQKWVYGVSGRGGYLKLLPPGTLKKLRRK
jgi:glutaconate CoA-transferase subunit A